MSVARKNGKTELAAMIALLMIATGGAAQASSGKWAPVPGAEAYSAATTKDQAALCWRAGATILRRSPDVRSQFEIRHGRYVVYHPESDAVFKALSAEADTLDGLGPYCAIVDELHAHPDGTVWDVLSTGMGAQREPLQLAITTAGSNAEGICWEVEQDVERILEGIYEDDSVFGMIFRGDDEDDAFDEGTWRKSNPNLGVSVILDGLRIDAKTAESNPARRNEFLRKRLNRWTSGETAWLNLDVWDKCDQSFDEADLKRRRCFVGYDLSSTRDTTAMVAVWPLKDGTLAVKRWVFVPADSIDDNEIRGPRERELMKRWVQDGLVIATPGDALDYDAVWQQTINLADKYGIEMSIFDRWHSSSLTAQCEQVGIERVGHGQGYKDMSPAMNETEVVLRRKLLRHGGDPVLRWMFSNLSIMTDPAGNIKPTKRKSNLRIDGMVALFMAVHTARSAPKHGSQIFVSSSSGRGA